MSKQNPLNLEIPFIGNWNGDIDSSNILREGTVEWWDKREIPLKKGILRFVGGGNYSDSFGFQWKRFSKDQVDSRSKLKITEERILKCTKWNPSELQDKWLLEAGCGAGRFTEVFHNYRAKIFTFDYSEAIDVCFANNAGKKNITFAQADILNLPTPPSFFDFVFCYGVLQHTPDPKRAFVNLVGQLKPGGKISIDLYLKDGKIQPWKAKYLWRWITVRLPTSLLYAIVWIYVPLWLPIDTILRKVPVIGKYLASIVPCLSWFNPKKPSWEGVRRTVLDTFDALHATYDLPQSIEDVKSWCNELFLVDIEVFEGANGLVANARKPG